MNAFKSMFVLALILMTSLSKAQIDEPDYISLANVMQIAQQQTFDYSPQGGALQDLAWSSDGNWLAIGGVNGISIYETETSQLSEAVIEEDVTSLTFHPSNPWLIYVSLNGSIGLFDLETAAAWTIDHPYDLQIAISPDGEFVATGSGDNTITLWVFDGFALKPWATLISGEDTGVLDLLFTPDSRQLLSLHSGYYGTEVWEVPRTAPVEEIMRPLATTRFDVASISFAIDPAGNVAFGLTSRRDDAPNVALFKRETVSRPAALPRWTQPDPQAFHVRPIEYTTAVEFNADGSLLVSGGSDGSVQIWDIANGRVLRELTAHNTWIEDIAFNTEGTILAVASRDGLIRLWGLK